MLFDFQDGNGLVPAHKHVNGGGWVASTAIVDDTAYVGPNARVFGYARVEGNAHVFGNARVYDNARVFGNARVYGNAWVFGNAWIYGYARVSGDVRVYRCVDVFEKARISGKGKLGEIGWYVHNNSRVIKYTDTMYLLEDGTIYFGNTGKVLENIKNPEQYFKNLARLRGEDVYDYV